MAKFNEHSSKTDMAPLLKSNELTRDALGGLITAAEAHGFKLVDWERFGTPAIDKVIMTAVGPTSGMGNMLTAVLKVPQLKPNLRIFPRGIPAFDEIQVEIAATAGH